MSELWNNPMIHIVGVFVIVIVLTIAIASLVNGFFRKLIARSTLEMSTDPTNYLFLRHAATAIIYIIGFSIAIYTVPQMRTLAQSLLAGAGILAVAMGFAAQHAFSNIIGGIFVIIFRPFRVQDRITVGTKSGIVEDITLRHTVIRNFENQRFIIPNSVISEEVITNSNFNDDRICKWIDVGISYDSDIDLAKSIMRDEVMKHPLRIDARTKEQIATEEQEVQVRVLNLGEFSVNLRAWAWAKDSPDGFVMSCDLFESIKKRFDKEGVEIPFPHRTLVHKNLPK